MQKHGLFEPEREVIMILRNVGKCSPNLVASHPSGQEYSATPMCESQILYYIFRAVIC